MDRLVDEAEKPGRDPDKARFAVTLLTSAVAPTNFWLGNPAAIKRTLETGGLNLTRGVRNWAGDLRHNGGMPSMADPQALQVGRDLALTPGAVVERDEVAELIQYTPATGSVRERPVLVVPPPIGRFYFLDLRPGRSFIEYSLARGLQTFVLSWRNPGKEQRDWDLDTYAARVLRAIDAIRDITGSGDVNTIGFCAGGIITTGVLNHLAATRDARIRSASFAVTMLDFGQRAPIQAFSNARLLSFARGRSRRAGVIAARDMGAAFTLMRPNDLIWNYWVNNYLMGQDPPVFDVLSWNADGTNLPAALHLQFLDLFQANALCRPGAMTVLHTPVDLSTIKVPTFATGAITDHLTPWKGCYRTTQLLSGPMTFVLSNSGHIQSLVNPPGNPKASYYTGAAAPSRCGPVARDRHQAHRVLVGGLGRLDHPALRRGTARPAVPGQPGLRTDDRGPRRLRPPSPRAMTGADHGQGPLPTARHPGIIQSPGDPRSGMPRQPLPQHTRHHRRRGRIRLEPVRPPPPRRAPYSDAAPHPRAGTRTAGARPDTGPAPGSAPPSRYAPGPGSG